MPPVEIPAHQPFAELNCELSAHTGLPSLVVPAGYTDGSHPVGIKFLSGAFAEPRLFELAHGFEKATSHRCPREGFDSMDADRTDGRATDEGGGRLDLKRAVVTGTPLPVRQWPNEWF